MSDEQNAGKPEKVVVQEPNTAALEASNEAENAPEKATPKVYTPEEIEAIAKKVEEPVDNTPPYNPVHKLSPEFEGRSNYERGMLDMTEELTTNLQRLEQDPNASAQEIKNAQENLKTLNYLYENYHLGMNVFRTAHGGRNKLRE